MAVKEKLFALEKEIFDLTQLLEISKSLNSKLNLDSIIESILLICMGQMHVISTGILTRSNLMDKTLKLHRKSQGFLPHSGKEILLPAEGPLANTLLEKPRCLTLEETRTLLPSDLRKKYRQLFELNPSLLVPLISKGSLHGFIILKDRIMSANDVFSPEEKQYLMHIAAFASIAIYNGLLYEMSNTDMLTGLKMRHYLISRMDELIKSSSPFSIIMMDIDFFKNLNDTYGHSCGDDMLKNTARILQENIRQNDTAARYGGEEFILLLENTEKEQARAIAERIRRCIERFTLIYNHTPVQCTISGGLTCYTENNKNNRISLVEQADEALYEAKKQGRNRICFSKNCPY